MDKSLHEYLKGVTELPAEMLLGRLVMFTISDNAILRPDLVKWFEELSLNSRFLPAENRPIDAFKKATSEVDERSYPISDGTEGILLTRKVTTNRDELQRGIVREVRDSKRRTLSHAVVVNATFYKPKTLHGRHQVGSERIRLTRINEPLLPEEIPYIDAAMQDIDTRYRHHVSFIDGNKVRAVVRNYLKYLNALEIKGGVYFVHENRTAELRRLQELVSRCGNRSRMDLIPLVDMANERDIIIEAFQKEAEDSLIDLVKNIAHVSNTRKTFSVEAYGKLKREYDTIMGQALEYQRTLKLTQTRTSNAAELALDALTEVQKRLLGD